MQLTNKDLIYEGAQLNIPGMPGMGMPGMGMPGYDQTDLIEQTSIS